MQVLDVGTVIFSIVLTWSVGLAPPLLIRFAFLKRPMGAGGAIGTALAFWIFNLGLFIALGSKSRSHAALAIVALVSYWILRITSSATEAAAAALKSKETPPDGTSELMTFAALGNLKAVRAQLDARADVNASDANGWTPLMYAASRDELEVVRLLLDRGAARQARNADGNTAGQVAREKGLDEVAGAIECPSTAS